MVLLLLVNEDEDDVEEVDEREEERGEFCLFWLVLIGSLAPVAKLSC